MNHENDQHDVGQRRDGPGYDLDNSDGDGDGNGLGEGRPQRQPYDPTPGLRKRTSILVGIVFVLLGLLMMFIAGDSAASIVSAHCGGLTGNADELSIMKGTGEFH